MPHTPCKLTACAGLGMVLTSTEQVTHPDPEHGMLPPQPILLVATSDGALRLFTFASQRRSAESVTRPALSYDDAPRPVVPAPAAQVLSSSKQPKPGIKSTTMASCYSIDCRVCRVWTPCIACW